MKYRLMAVDIDGTLLNSNGIMTDNTIEVIKRAVKKGLVFTISTGRPVQGVKSIIEKLNIDFPIITYNGAMVVMGDSGKILYEKKLTFQDAKSIIDLGGSLDVTVVVWNNNKLYVNVQNEKTRFYSSISGVTPVLCKDIKEAIKDGATKVLWYDNIEKINQYKDQIEKYFSENITYHTSRPYFLEFVDRNASKAIAMEKLGEYYDIDSKQMIAVGDGYNDLSMIEYAGLGIAMGNAPQEIKNKADYVTLSNDRDGLVHVIAKFI